MKTNIHLFDVLVISGTQQYELHSTITSTLHEDQYTFLIISRSKRFRMKNVSYKNFRGNQNTHFTSF